MVYVKVAIILLNALALSACSLGRSFYDRPANIFGVGSMIKPVPFEQINLVHVLDPQNKGADDYPAPDSPDEAKSINVAFDTFTTKYSSSTRTLRRNAVQERLLAASNQRCNYFKNALQSARAGANFGLGSLATATGAAGAIASGFASQVLSGTAAIFSGVRAEYNQEFFPMWQPTSLYKASIFVVVKSMNRSYRTAKRSPMTNTTCKRQSRMPFTTMAYVVSWQVSSLHPTPSRYSMTQASMSRIACWPS